MPKLNAQKGKVFRERKKKLAASPVEKVTRKKTIRPTIQESSAAPIDTTYNSETMESESM
ncbi:hypothetical protein TNCV_2950151 [Trichonephila clavipes]|nr:hypothetical protein TNCV_2950151 [Trichonephila clavipes]